MMITDTDANFVYLPDTLEVRFTATYLALTRRFSEFGIGFGRLPGTKDIWARDYMPILCSLNDFLLFRYDPDYLKPKKWQKSKTDGEQICRDLGIPIRKSDLVVDGGNVIRGRDFVIMTDKVFSENRNLSPKGVLRQLEELFEVQVIIIPQDPTDYTGHADGMVRYYKDRTVLINRYAKQDRSLYKTIVSVLTENKVDFRVIPYNPYQNSSTNDATGLYINFLQLHNVIFLPAFGLPQDDEAAHLFEDLFPESRIIQVSCNELSTDGGVLNCVSWSIMVDKQPGAFLMSPLPFPKID